MRYPQTVEVDTVLGTAQATKPGQDEPWQIGYPWTDDRFYGSRPQVTARMKKAVKKYEAENPDP
jgi:hypothetical protein